MSSDNLDAFTIQGGVIFKKPTPGEWPHYDIPDNRLSHGASLGNGKIWVNTKSTGSIEGIFYNALGLNAVGSVVITYAVPANIVVGSSPEPGCLQVTDQGYLQLRPEAVGTISVYPFKQSHSFEFPDELQVEETVMVPKFEHDDPPVVLQHVNVTNLSLEDVTLLITVYADMRGDTQGDVTIDFDKELGALVARNSENPDLIRIMGLNESGVGYRVEHDVSHGYTGIYGAEVMDVTKKPDSSAPLQFEMHVKSGETSTTTLTVAISHKGEDAAKKWYQTCSRFEDFEESTTDYLNPISSTSMVDTPDNIINQGVFWAKINMLRVKADYPEGTAFTNEPGKSANVVGRDVAWFIYGCDYLMPDFSRTMLLKFAEKQYPSGKIPEYYSALDGHVEDYGLSMNDDTPLFVLACCHHYAATKDKDFLQKIYPHAKLAAEYILNQRDERGLIYAEANGTNVEGIASWRNVLPNYQINGAVTEINSECYAALRHLTNLCSTIGDSEEAEKMEQAAFELAYNINHHLVNPTIGMYYLNIDESGVAHTDVTTDEVFPLLFEVAEGTLANRIITRLRADDFMTSAGLRTVSRNSPDYEPSDLVGLKGGVWPGVAFWYAFAAAKINPAFMVDSIHASYLHYLRDPLKNNTVPGQFAEWFDGESLVNRGMRLSPWEPPRLLWAALEGLCGAVPNKDGCHVEPTAPPDWKWVALRRFPIENTHLTFFATMEKGEMTIYSNMEVTTPHKLMIVGDDVTHKVRVHNYRVHRAAFHKDDVLTVCLGTESDVYATAVIDLIDLVEDETDYSVRIYSYAGGWIELGETKGSQLRQMAISIEDGQFRLMIIKKASA